MAGKRKLSISLKRDEALLATRVTIRAKKLVYVLVCDKRFRYETGRSRIAYIGTTKRGVKRVASSMAVKVDEILTYRGVRKVHARIITCTPRQGIETWRKLERALLLVFREAYGEPPMWNVHGKRMKERDEFRYFRKRRLEQLLEELG